MPETVLNLRGLRCPLPALKTRKALAALANGETLVVACTDPMSAIDIPNLVRETRNLLDSGRLEADPRHGQVYVFRIVKRDRVEPGEAALLPPSWTRRT